MCNVYIWLKKLDTSDYQERENCVFAIPGWLGQPKIENLIAFVARLSELISYLKVSFAKYSPSIFSRCSRFPYQESTINEWFALSTEGEQREQGLNIINVDRHGQARKCYTTQNQTDKRFPESLEDDKFEAFFHGTSHRSAKNIIENGIIVRKGKTSQDFSHEDGFYLSKSFEEAWRWTKSRWPSSAVLIFRVNKRELRGDENENGLDLRNAQNKKQWQKIVSQFRSGRPDPKFRRELNRSYHFIEGPMASLSRRNPRVDYPRQKDGSYQLCVRHDNCAELFDRSLHSVVFFEK